MQYRNSCITVTKLYTETGDTLTVCIPMVNNLGNVLDIWLDTPRIACIHIIRKRRIQRIKGNSVGVTGHG